MSQIGSLANTASQTFDLSYYPQFLQVGDPDNADTFNGLTTVGRGNTLIQLTNGAQIRAIMQTEQMLIGAGASTELGSRLWLASGRIPGASTITIGNAGATTTAVYQNSVGKSMDFIARKIAVTPVVANGNNVFRNFDQLLFLPANFDRAQVTFTSGWTEEMTAAELQGLFLANNNSEASGLVNGFIVVQGLRAPEGYGIQEITVFAGSGGNCDVVECGFVRV